MPGPRLLTDIVEVYAFRRLPRPADPAQGAVAASIPCPHDLEFLQIRRTKAPMAGAWNTVMGHVEPGETAAQAALRELAEETGFAPAAKPSVASTPTAPPGRLVLRFWQLELVNTYFLASLDAVMLSPGFAVELSPGQDPILDEAHDASRWVPRDHAPLAFLWPGQRAAIDHIVHDILAPTSLTARRLELML